MLTGPSIPRTKHVTPGDWRTLESGWNASFSCIFGLPVGAQVKVRFGDGSWLGRDSQKQTLDGNARTLVVGRGSLAWVQIRVRQATGVDYVYVTTGP